LINKEPENVPTCSECGNALLLKNVPMLKKNYVWNRVNDVRKCPTCGYISDIGLRLVENEIHSQYELSGIDPLGSLDINSGKWV
jgi:hypothetical protein